eukprot:TRINITY_DN42254_c0_g1_i1.p1 TRINITY_DN42254_c0_g1~~TRINITY_DN42254_c0_g1_i1.p1  ORF type:complete len:520 (-),score=77.50 TRINITY_DN42254_c0_g1_i1:186-1745(-)
MGQCTGGNPRPPSAMQLCQAFSQHSADSRLSRRAGLPPRQGQDVHGVWQLLSRDEVQALGDIVWAWARGLIDGHAARRQLQLRVLRGLSPELQSSFGLPFGNSFRPTFGAERLGGSSSFSAGLAGVQAPVPAERQSRVAEAVSRERPGEALSGGRMGGGANQNAGSDCGQTPADSTSSTEGREPAAVNVHASRGLPSRTPAVESLLEAWSPMAATRSPFDGRGSLRSLHNMIGGGGLPAMRPEGQVNAAPAHEVFSTIDAVFLCRIYEDARGLAMRELGLDGYSPVADEVRASFQERAVDILDTVEEHQVNNSAFLDLVKLCLCVEVLRHLRAPTPGSVAAARGPLVSTSPSQQALAASSLTWPRQRSPARRLDGLHGGPRVDLVVVMGGSRVEDGTNMVVIGLSGPTLGTADGHFRTDSTFLHNRVASLLTALLGAGTEGRMQGRAPLSDDEINTHCPLGARSASDDGCCPICLENSILGEIVRTFPCGHCFHQECCQAWLSTADTCPTCRFQVPRSN